MACQNNTVRREVVAVVTVRYCRACGKDSERLYRCDGCGHDLTGTSEPARHIRPSTNLVDVEFQLECLGCRALRSLPLAYRHVGQVLRLGCPHCEEPTKHRPTGEDLRRQGIRLFGRDQEYRPPTTPEDFGDIVATLSA